MKIKNKKSDGIDFYYNKKASNEMLEMTKYCLRNKRIDKNNFELIKKGNQREVYKAIIDSEIYYFKKYCYRSFDKKLKNIFRKSAAYNSFKRSNDLIENGISVVKPVLAAEIKHNHLTVDSVFITKDFGGTDLQQFLAEQDYSAAEKEKIIISLAKLWSKLYKKNYLNGDPNLPGVLLNFDDKLKLSLVDVDNFKQVIYLTKKRIIRNLAKFNAHSYSGLAKMGGKKLKNADRKLFLQHLIRNYKRLEKMNLYQAVQAETFNILKAWGKSELIKRCNY